MTDLKKDIEALLGEPPEVARTRERETFPTLLGETDGTVVLFGAGRLGRLCARALLAAGIPLRGFCDGKRDLHGTIAEGMPVFSLAEAAERFGGKSLFCVSTWSGSARESMRSRLEQLRELGCSHAVSFAPLLWAHGKGGLPFHSFALPSSVLQAGRADLAILAGSLADGISVAVLRHALRQRLLGEFSCSPPTPDQYFPAGLAGPSADEVVVDGGAFTGDTLDEFIAHTGGRFGHYHAFEPDERNLAGLRKRVETLPVSIRERITIHSAGLYSRDDQVNFAANAGVTSAIGSSGAFSIAVTSLDSVGIPATFVKLDVEGAEFHALQGATDTLRNNRPKLAVCVYHNPEDLWTIPRLVRCVLPGHHFHLRQHAYDGWELVLYAQPA